MDKSLLDSVQNRWTRETSIAGMQLLNGTGRPPFPSLLDDVGDLRGLAITQFIKNATISKMDLSGSTIDGFGQFGMCSMRRCIFAHSRLGTNLGSLFEKCDFTAASLSGAILRGKFVECDFTSANLTSVVGDGVEFVRCVFAKTNFRKATLTHCLFEECRFENCKFGSGSLSFSKFVQSTIDAHTLGNTLMEKVVLY